MPYQLSSPAYSIQSQGSQSSSQLANYNIEKLFSTLSEINGQLLGLRQQQASSINAIGSLSNDVANLTSWSPKEKNFWWGLYLILLCIFKFINFYSQRIINCSKMEFCKAPSFNEILRENNGFFICSWSKRGKTK